MKIKQTRVDFIFSILVTLFLSICLLLVAYPLIFVVSASVSDSFAVTRGDVWLLPVGFDLKAYQTIFTTPLIVRGYLNSFMYTILGTCFNLILTVLAAYSLSRKKLFGRGIVTWYFLITMFFNGGLIPTYLLMDNIKLINTLWAVVLSGGISIYNMIIMRTYFSTAIPEELYEAAHLDGCGDIRALYKIVLPLSKSIIAVIMLYYAVGHWNGFFNAMIYTSDPNLSPLQLVLRELLILNNLERQISQSAASLAARIGVYELLRYAVIVVASVPMLILYPFVQKHFVKGVMIGSVKG